MESLLVLFNLKHSFGANDNTTVIHTRQLEKYLQLKTVEIHNVFSNESFWFVNKRIIQFCCVTILGKFKKNYQIMCQSSVYLLKVSSEQKSQRC